MGGGADHSIPDGPRRPPMAIEYEKGIMLCLFIRSTTTLVSWSQRVAIWCVSARWLFACISLVTMLVAFLPNLIRRPRSPRNGQRPSKLGSRNNKLLTRPRSGEQQRIRNAWSPLEGSASRWGCGARQPTCVPCRNARTWPAEPRSLPCKALSAPIYLTVKCPATEKSRGSYKCFDIDYFIFIF